MSYILLKIYINGILYTKELGHLKISLNIGKRKKENTGGYLWVLVLMFTRGQSNVHPDNGTVERICPFMGLFVSHTPLPWAWPFSFS